MASDDLRARIVEALNTTPTKLLDGHPESLAFHADQLTWDMISARHDRHTYMATCALCRGEAETLADAVMALVAPELERLHRQLDDARSELYTLRPAASRLEGEVADWRAAAYRHAGERDDARTACRSAAVLLRSVADEGAAPGTLLDAARALDDVAGPERPWITDPPTPCQPVPCDDCPICKEPS